MPDLPVMVASTGGYGFLCRLADMVSNRKAGREFMTLEPSEVPVAPVVYDESSASMVAAISAGGRLLIFDIGEMRSVARGRGVILMGLDDGEALAAATTIAGKSVKVAGIGRAGKEKLIDISGVKFEHYFGRRARMGRVLPDKLKPTGFVQ